MGSTGTWFKFLATPNANHKHPRIVDHLKAINHYTSPFLLLNNAK